MFKLFCILVTLPSFKCLLSILSNLIFLTEHKKRHEKLTHFVPTHVMFSNLLQGYIQHNEEEDEGHDHAHDGNQVSIFDGLNQRLLDVGLPRWNLGEHVIEPIVTVGFLLAFLLMGFRGVLFAGLLFAVNKMSQRRGGIGGLLRSFTGAGNTQPSSQRRNQGRMGSRRGPGQSPPSTGGNRLGGNKLGSS